MIEHERHGSEECEADRREDPIGKLLPVHALHAMERSPPTNFQERKMSTSIAQIVPTL